MIESIIHGFEWDNGNLDKCQKHGVSIEEIEEAFTNNPLIAPDHKHSSIETRFLAVGKTKEGRYIFVAFTFRVTNKKKFIRPISARYMHAKEIKAYEKEHS